MTHVGTAEIVDRLQREGMIILVKTERNEIVFKDLETMIAPGGEYGTDEGKQKMHILGHS